MARVAAASRSARNSRAGTINQARLYKLLHLPLLAILAAVLLPGGTVPPHLGQVPVEPLSPQQQTECRCNTTHEGAAALEAQPQQQQQQLQAAPAPPPRLTAWRQTPGNLSIPSLRACVRAAAGSPRWAAVLQQYAQLPRLAIVMTFSADHLSAAAVAAMHNMEAYASRHGYLFYAPIINVDDWSQLTDDEPDLHHFFTIRWLHLQRRFLGSAQWVLGLDGDVFALQAGRSLDGFLDLEQDVVLHLRTNYEVAASAVLLRSSPFAHCFLKHWIRKGTEFAVTKYNWDNGDLLQTVLDVLGPRPAADCAAVRHKYDEFIACFRRYHPDVYALPSWAPIRVFWPMGGGFWRGFEGLRDPKPGESPASALHTRAHFSCSYPSDVLGHHWKAFDHAWPRHLRRAASANASSVDMPFGCLPLTSDDEVALVRSCCYAHSPACLVQQQNQTVNTCLQETRCSGGGLFEWQCHE